MNYKCISTLAASVLLSTVCLSSMAATPQADLQHDYAHTKTQFVKVGDVRYAYRTLGQNSNTPTLIMFQHFTGTMDDWDSALIEGLAQTRKVVVFDNVGVSASSGTTPDTVAEMAVDAEKFIDALKLGKVDILGFSLGGCIAQQVLADRPELVRKAVIAGSSAKGGEGVKDTPKVISDATKVSNDTKIPLKRVLFFSQTPLGLAAGEAFMKRINNHVVDPEKAASEQTVDAQMKALITWGSDTPNYKELGAIKQPVLIVNGNNDIMMPTVNSYTMFKQIPNSQLSLYPDSGHGGLFQHNKLFVSQVNMFLK